MSDEDAMVEFIGTFTTLSGSPPESMSDLSDGVALFEALSEMYVPCLPRLRPFSSSSLTRCRSAPTFFDPTTIARQLGDNWALKSSNLRKLLRNLQEYYHSIRKDTDWDKINVASIARQADAESLEILVQLVAAAAVTCEEKGTYVHRILSMSEGGQASMKVILEQALERLTDRESEYSDGEGDENELVFNDESTIGNNTLMTNNNELFNHNDDELRQLRQELSQLKLQTSESTKDHQQEQEKLRAIVQDLQDRLVQRQDELIQVEEDLNTATNELTETKDKLAQVAAERTQLADDLDVAQAKAQQLHKAEATLVAYKKRMESVGVMNQQMTDLEDQAANYLQQIMELESQVKKSASLQRSVQDLQAEVDKLRKEASQAESTRQSQLDKIAQLETTLAAAESAKKMYQEELTDLKAQHESSDLSTDERDRATRLAMENVRLQKEVQALKAGGAIAASTSKDSVDTLDTAKLQQEVARLKEDLVNKEIENAKISSDKDKLEAYTKRTLAKFQDKYLVALQECKAKLKEKQDKIEALENRSASERTAQKREERLLSSTLYELGLAIMQNKLKER